MISIARIASQWGLTGRKILAITSLVVTSGSSLTGWASPIQMWRENPIRQPVTPEAPTVSWSIETSDSSLVTLAQAAVQQWQDVDTSYITFNQVTAGTDASIQIVILNSLSNAYAGGQAITAWNSDGNITQCTIELLDSALNTGNSDYSQMILAHEFGHCLGLAHSIANHAVMSYRDPAPTLTADDRYALTLLYPNDGESLPLGCATTRSPQKPGSKDPRRDSFFFTLMMMIAGMLWLRKKQKLTQLAL